MHNKTDEFSPLTLAFVGDGVYDLLVREYLVRLATMVNCKSQARFASKLMPCLTEKETAVYKRGRNAAPKSTAKNGTLAEYHSATGLECLFGYLYLSGEKDRIDELFKLITELDSNK